MPVLRFRDDGSIGQALSQLATGVNTMFDPRLQLQGDVMRQQIAASRANQAQTELQTRQLQEQMAAQQQAVSALGGVYDANNPRPDFTMPADMQGPPVPAPMQQQQLGAYDANRAFTLANARNAYMRGGGPMEAVKVGPFALGMGQVMQSGAPTNEQTARTTQTMLTGQLPDAKTPLTDAGRGVLNAEDIARQQAIEGFKISKTPLDVTGNKTYAIPQMDGTHRIFGPAQYGGGAAGSFYGDSELAQAERIMETTVVKMRNNAATPADIDAYDVAWHRLYGPKTEIRDNNGQKQVVQIQNPIPANRPAPAGLRQALGFGSPAPAPAPAATPPADTPAPGVPGGAAPPAPASPAQGAPAGTAAGTGVVSTIGEKSPMGSEATSLQGFVSQMEASDKALTDMSAQGKIPGVLARMRTDPGTYSSDEKSTLREYGPEIFGDAQAKEYMTHKNAFLDALLRKQSGAVIGTNEYQKVATYTIPNSGDAPQVQAQKAAYRALLINAYKGGLFGADPKETLAKAIQIIESQQQQTQGRAPAPGGADPYADVDAIVGIRR